VLYSNKKVIHGRVKACLCCISSLKQEENIAYPAKLNGNTLVVPKQDALHYVIYIQYSPRKNHPSESFVRIL